MLRLAACCTLLALCFCAALPQCAGYSPVTFTFTKVVDTAMAMPWSGGGVAYGLGNPAVAAGRVVFPAYQDSSWPNYKEGIFTNRTGSLTVVADKTTDIPGGVGKFTGFSVTSPLTSDNGFAVFEARGANNQHGIYRDTGTSLTTIADTNANVPGQGNTFTNLFGPSAEQGNVAFEGVWNSGSGIYAKVGGTLVTVADTFTSIPGASGTFTAFTSDVSLSQGKVAFNGGGNYARGIYLRDLSSGATSVVADVNTSKPGASGTFGGATFEALDSDAGNVAFRTYESSGDGIYARIDGALRVVANHGMPIPGRNGPTFYWLDAPSIQGGNVVFWGADAGNANIGIYGLIGDQFVKVIATGDSLDGKTVGSLWFDQDGFQGDTIAFRVSLNNGPAMSIYTAQIVPEPSTLALLGIGAIGLLGYRWRRRSVRHAPPTFVSASTTSPMVLVLTLTVGFASVNVFAVESPPVMAWMRTETSYSWGTAQSIVVDTTGNVYAAGWINTTAGGDDIWVQKYDSHGNTLWTAGYATVGQDRAYGIAVDAQGNAYVAGGVWADGVPNMTPWIRKYDPAGNVLWTQTDPAGAATAGEARGIALGASGNVYAVGSTQTTVSRKDLWVRKYDSAGNIDWKQTYVSPSNENAGGMGVAADKQGNVLVAGWEWRSDLQQAMNGLVAKYGNSGNLVWTRSFTSPGWASDDARGIATDSSGNAYVTGMETIDSPSQSANIFVRKYSAGGDTAWTQMYNGAYNGYDYGQAATVDSQGNVYIVGAEEGYNSGYDFFMRKYDSAGNPLWTTKYVGPGYSEDFGYGIALGPGDSICVAGRYGAHPWVAEYVPEPSTFVLLGMGAIGLLSFAWRRRKRAA